MEKIISSFLAGAFVVLICLLTMGKTFAHTFQDEDQSEAPRTANSTDNSSDNYVKGITLMRGRSLVGIGLGLLSVVIGWRARKRSSEGIGKGGRNGAKIALLMGGIALVLSVIHLNISAGAVFGSGSGRAGAIFALILSLVGIGLSGMVFRQKRV
jgi:hypothetical protein